MASEGPLQPQVTANGSEGETVETPSLLSGGQSSSELSSPVVVELCEVEEEEEAKREQADELTRPTLLEEDCSDPELEELLDSELRTWRAPIRIAATMDAED